MITNSACTRLLIFKVSQGVRVTVTETSVNSLVEISYCYKLHHKLGLDIQKLKKQITIRLDEDTIEYFKGMAEKKGIPYQSLINLYLRDCAQAHRDLKLQWQ